VKANLARGGTSRGRGKVLLAGTCADPKARTKPRWISPSARHLSAGEWATENRARQLKTLTR